MMNGEVRGGKKVNEVRGRKKVNNHEQLILAQHKSYFLYSRDFTEALVW